MKNRFLYTALAFLFVLLSVFLPLQKVSATPTPFQISSLKYSDNYTKFKNYLLFVNYDRESNVSQLIRTSGSASDMIVVKTFTDRIYGLTVVGENIFFFGGDGAENYGVLWKTDGTAGGTSVVRDINGKEILNSYSHTAYNGVLYITSQDESGYNAYLYRTDGTQAGTYPIEHFDNGTSDLDSVTLVGNQLYFVCADYALNDYKIWRTDGSVGSATTVYDFHNSAPGELTAANDFLYFTTYNYEGEHPRQLWGISGDTVTSSTLLDPALNLGILLAVDDTLYFSYEEAGQNNFSTWSTNNEMKIATKISDTEITKIYKLNNQLYYFGNNSQMTGSSLMKITPNGTVEIKDFPGFWNGLAGSASIIDGKLYFTILDYYHGYELWSSDGTSVGTNMLADFRRSEKNGGRGYYSFSNVIEMNDALFFGISFRNEGQLIGYSLANPVFVNLPGLTSQINLVDGQSINTSPYIIKVKPTDGVGISNVKFFVDDVQICDENKASLEGVYSCAWDATKHHSDIKVLAYDNNGNVSVPLTRSTTVDPKLYLTVLPKTGKTK